MVYPATKRGLAFDLEPDSDSLPVQGVLEKPVQPKQLLAKVAELISG